MVPKEYLIFSRLVLDERRTPRRCGLPQYDEHIRQTQMRNHGFKLLLPADATRKFLSIRTIWDVCPGFSWNTDEKELRSAWRMDSPRAARMPHQNCNFGAVPEELESPLTTCGMPRTLRTWQDTTRLSQRCSTHVEWRTTRPTSCFCAERRDAAPQEAQQHVEYNHEPIG